MAQYRVLHPPVTRAEQKRQAQARYRKRHAKRLAQVRVISNILTRQTGHAGDLRRLAAALRAGLSREEITALRALLRETLR